VLTKLKTAIGFRGRLVAGITVITMVTLGLGFTVIEVVVTRSQERHFDHALVHAAHGEVAEIAATGRLAISARPGPAPNDVGPLPKYGAIYGPGGEVQAATTGFRAANARDLRRTADSCFDMRFGGENLRAVVAPIPSHPGTTLLLAAPRADLDGDAVFLRRAMELVFIVAVGWTVAVASFVVRMLTKNQRRIAEVVRRVAAGDLTARVGALDASGDEAQLIQNLDEMIERLQNLFNAQRVFIAHAAHELRSPLSALYGELALALRRSRDAAEYRRAIEEAFASTRQLKGLAEDLLAVARLGATPPPSVEPIEVRGALDEAREIVAADGVAPDVRLEVSGRCRPALASHRDLVRLLRNLLENAVRHSPQGGAVHVSLSDEGRDVAIAVTDEGSGIAREERGKIFTPFYRGTTVPTVSGAETGLGLTIARGIARAYGGDVVLDDAATAGACFRVTLPGADEAERGHALPQEAGSETPSVPTLSQR
jgi:two-component system heavy metal sensor histidine kinase CusS